jgi:hypothetical protein
MNKLVLSLVAGSAGLAGLAVTSASAAPIGNLSGLGNDTVQVAHRMVCDRAGRCYRAAHRNVRRQYVVRDYDEAPSYGYAPGYAPGYAYGPGYGYAPGYSYGGPGYGYWGGGPSIGFGIGVGPRW